MKREIIFRGKRTDNKEWVYGDLITGLNDLYYIRHIIEYGTVKRAEITMVDKETIGQYTGLKDINDKKFYSGDIISYHIYNDFVDNKVIDVEDYRIGAIEFRDGGFFTSKDDDITVGLWCDSPEAKTEIIGNIYENPELLK